MKITGKNWISALPESTKNKSIANLTIPGTHDSGTSDLKLAWSTQYKTIEEQLNFGVRFLDIRLSLAVNLAGQNCKLVITHGKIPIVGQDYSQSFDDVLDVCEDFLKSNPGEFIIMSVKQEDESPGWMNYFTEVWDKRKGLFLQKEEIPTVNEAKGRIVLLKRFSSTAITGIKFDVPDDTEGEKAKNNTNIYIQDKYNVGYTKDHDKKKAVESCLDKAQKDTNTDTLYVNFISAVGHLDGKELEAAEESLDKQGLKWLKWTSPAGILVDQFVKHRDKIVNPKRFANDKMNPFLMRQLCIRGDNRYGCLLMDCIEEKHARKIYFTNFKEKPVMIGYSNNRKRLFTQPLMKSSGWKSYEIEAYEWDGEYSNLMVLNTNGEQYIAGQRSSNKRFFTQKIDENGFLADNDYGVEWQKYFGSLCSFKVGGKTYIAGQSTSDNKFFIQEVYSNGKLANDESYSDEWGNYYGSLCAFEVGGKTYIASQSTSKNMFFIQEVLTGGKLANKESYISTWSRYYSSIVPFEVGGKTYLVCHSSKENKTFIQEVLSNGKLGSETYNKNWKNYYGSLCVFQEDGKTYLAAQSTSGNRFFIQEILSNGKLANTEAYNKKWGNYYDNLLIGKVKGY